MPMFNFSSYYLNETLSDVVVQIVQDNRVVTTLPGHGIVLANVSQRFKQGIEQHKGSKQQATISLDVGEGQVLAAEALVQYVYQGSLPSAGQQVLLVHVLHLSYRFGVVDCTGACLSALLAISNLQMEAIHLVFSLLPTAGVSTLANTACAGPSTRFQPLIQHCLNHLQQQYGDLEVTVGSPQLDSFQQLPHAALLALLHDERTAAASENTALAAVQIWLAAQQSVDSGQRHSLAAAIRVPLLEPCYLTTVLPRMPWLLEILGPQGLAMAAGAARAMFDPHAEPCMSNPRACSSLAAGWLAGPRPLPASCTSSEQEGPQINIRWQLPLAAVKQAFEAACAAAAAAAGAWAQTEATAAAANKGPGPAAQQQEHPAAPMAAAVSAAAAAAVKMGASIFGKRKRASQEEHQQYQHGHQQSSTPAVPVQQGALMDATNCHAEHGFGSRQKRQRRVTSAATEAAAVAGVQQTPAAIHAGHCSPAVDRPTGHDRRDSKAAQQAARPAVGRQESATSVVPNQLKLHTQAVQFAGYSWRLVLYFQASRADGSIGSSTHVPTVGAATSIPSVAGAAQPYEQFVQQLSQQLWRPQPEGIDAATGSGIAAGSREAAQHWLGVHETPGGSRRGRRAAAAVPTTAPAHKGQQLQGLEGRHSPERGFGHAAAAPPAGERLAVAAVAAMRLPDEASPAAGAAAVARRGLAGTAEEQASTSALAAIPACGWVWHARLAVEAWPCIALQPGVSTVAFSGRLAVQLHTSGNNAGTFASQQHPADAATAVVAAAAMQAAAEEGFEHNHGASGGGGRKASRDAARHRTSGRVQGCTAAAAVRAPRSSSTAIPAEGPEPGWDAAAAPPARGRSLGTRRAAAMAAARSIQQQTSLTTSESDVEDGRDQGSDKNDDGHVEYSNDDSDEADDVLVVEPAETGRAAAGLGQQPMQHGLVRRLGAATGNSGGYAAAHIEGSGSREGSQALGPEAAGAIGGTGFGFGLDEAQHGGQQQHSRARRLSAAAAATAVDASARGAQTGNVKWQSFHLPQSSWVKSRKCDTGFRNFFSITLQQGQWDEGQWATYLQPGGVLQLQGTFWNIR